VGRGGWVSVSLDVPLVMEEIRGGFHGGYGTNIVPHPEVH
jgi:hypothetical protein